MRWIMLVFASVCCLGAAPTRDNIYVTDNKIKPNENMANEDAIFTYLQNGVDTYALLSVNTAALANNAVTSAKIVDGTITQADLAFTINPGNSLPSGAIFFMLSGSCPTWTTDVSATYANDFVKINATPGTLGGASTHTHGTGSFVGPVHTHALSDMSSYMGWNAAKGGTSDSSDATIGSQVNSMIASVGGGGAITGTSDSASNEPLSVTAKLCKVN